MFDVVTYLENKGYVPRWLKENEVTIDCIYCGKGKGHFQISTQESNATFYCFKCNRKGSWVSLVARLDNVSFDKAREVVYGSLNLSVDKKEEFSWPIIDLPPSSYWTNDALRFIRDEKKLTQSLINFFDLRYCSVGKYKNRVIIPIRMNGRILSFQARAIYGERLRYLSPENSPTNRMLFNYDSLVDGYKIAILVEGPFDVMNLFRLGYQNAVATFGKRLSSEQVDLLKDAEINNVILAYDPDLSGEELINFVDKISLFFDVGLMPLIDKDPGDLNEEEAYGMMENIIYDKQDMLNFMLNRRNMGAYNGNVY